jgi:hypothetical protein
MGLDFVVISDHSTLAHSLDPEAISTPDLQVLFGFEWTSAVHAGIVGATSVIPKLPDATPGTWAQDIQSVVDQTHAQGAAFVINHPCWASFPWVLPVQRVDAIEVWNSFYTVMDIGLHPTSARRVQERMDEKGLTQAGAQPSAEIMTATTRGGSANDQAIRYWEAFLERGDQVAAVGGSDRHKWLPPGYPTTWVYAPTRDRTDVTGAIRAGRTLVTQGPEGPFVHLEADANQDGIYEAMVGDTVGTGGLVNFRVRVEGARGGVLRLYKRRSLEAVDVAIDSDNFTFAYQDFPAHGDWYRAEVLEPIDWSMPWAGHLAAFLPGGTQSPSSLSFLFTILGVSVSVQTNSPVFTFDRYYRNLLNIDMATFSHARAAFTSPIYAR